MSEASAARHALRCRQQAVTRRGMVESAASPWHGSRLVHRRCSILFNAEREIRLAIDDIHVANEANVNFGAGIYHNYLPLDTSSFLAACTARFGHSRTK